MRHGKLSISQHNREPAGQFGRSGGR